MTRDSFDPGYCAYGAARIRGRVKQLAAEIEGVRKAEDIEAVHRMRVASRRIRAALPLFSCCVPKKKYDRWTREIRNVTRALGAARDKDVQIEFLKKYRKRFSRRKEGALSGGNPPLFHTPENSPSDQPESGAAACPASFFPPRSEYGIDCLLLRYRQMRRELQGQVLRDLSRLAKDRTPGQMEDHFRNIEMSAGFSGDSGRPLTGYRMAARHIGALTEELRVCSQSLAYPDRKEDHHRMRIVAKRLRYTMELYGDLYKGGLRSEIRKLRKLQDFLGEIHDCDVWTESLPRFLEEERERAEAYFGSGQFIRLIEPGITRLIRNRENQRNRLFVKLGITWQELEESGFWDRLPAMAQQALLDEEGQDIAAPDRPVSPALPADLADQARSVHARYPFGGEHSREVADLALWLFDNLRPLHGLGEESRKLLECAALLHDIGWVTGGKGHHRTSARIILAEPALSLGSRERSLVALIARSHRGRFPESGIPGRALPPQDRAEARALAAILRIADGLSVTRDGFVKPLRCDIENGSVTLVISAPKDPALEIAAALRKADLFRAAFSRSLHIVREAPSR
ncbi:MAG: CHAD domain-containing protein [Methanoregulaceae archaeon]